MTQVPPNIVTMQDLMEWDSLKQQLNVIKNKEMLLRKKIFGAYFPNPVEGTNTAPLNAGYELKGKYNIDRSVDEAALVALSAEFAKEGIIVDQLIKRKPELVLKNYRELTAEQRHTFDQCLLIKPGSPALEIKLPASARTKNEGDANS